MMYRVIVWIVLILVFLAYFPLINTVSFEDTTQETKGTYADSTQGYQLSVGFSDSYSASLVRERWYGTLYISGEDKVFYLFDLFHLPIEKNGFKVYFIHIIFIGAWVTILLILLIPTVKKSKSI